MRIAVWLVLVGVVAACGDAQSAMPTEDCPPPVRLLSTHRARLLGMIAPGGPSYLIIFREGTPPGEAERLSQRYGFQLKRVLRDRAFTEEFDDEVLDMLRCEPAIESLSKNGTYSVE
jgi:hypothetical protein